MAEEQVIKVSSEIPAELAPKSSPADVSLVDNPRQRIEAEVMKANDTIPERVEEEEAEVTPEVIKEEVVKEESTEPLDRIKKSVQKRIDKVVAQKKSAEDELTEARAEIERLKSRTPESTDKKIEGNPTPEQVEAYIIKMREEGNVKEEISATRYLIKLEKEAAIKEVQDEQNKVQTESRKSSEKQLKDWSDLNRDYIVHDDSGKPDTSHELSLTNQNGLLYKTAMSLYQDKDLNKDFYSDPDRISGFRRAVSDAYREIHQQGLYKPVKKLVVDGVLNKPIRKAQLAEPDAEAEDQTPQDSNEPSATDKVREELKFRKKLRTQRNLA